MASIGYSQVYENDEILQSLKEARSNATGESIQNIEGAIEDRKKKLRTEAAQTDGN